MITLPPRIDGPAETVDTQVHRHIVVIGANGAGKTRFSDALCAGLGAQAMRLNAVDALYNECAPDSANAVDRMHSASSLGQYEKQRPQLRLDRLLAMLMADELVNLLRFKFSTAGAGAPSSLPPTRLDSLIAFWQEVFPGNRLLVQGGKLLFGREDTQDVFAAPRLSDGERAVLYYGTALLYAPQNAVVMVDSPEIFLHPVTIQSVWNRLERLRPDCTLVYTTHDLDFASSRNDGVFVWVRSCDLQPQPRWDYQIIPDSSLLTQSVGLSLMGTRRPVLFIEGDSRSIDARLYPLIFPDCSVSSLGSCNKVIEAVRTFNDLNGFHHLTARGIVDRDRRDASEVAYLRRKNIMVPEVAEIENILLLPEIIRSVARDSGHDPEKVLQSVRRTVLSMFRKDVKAQALMHTRHRVKRTVEYRVDGRFPDINSLEAHLDGLLDQINPRALYEGFCRDFHRYASEEDYASVLRVYNQKSMLPGCNVASLCGYKNKDEYIDAIMRILSADGPGARTIRAAVRQALQAPEPEAIPAPE